MNKTDLINRLAERLDGDKKTAQVAVEGFIDLVQREVHGGESVSISGFGVFEKRARAARTARNPRTGEAVKVKRTTVPAFRPGKYFKDVIAGTVKMPKSTGGAPLSARAAAAAAKAKTSRHHGNPGAARHRGQDGRERWHPNPRSRNEDGRERRHPDPRVRGEAGGGHEDRGQGDHHACAARGEERGGQDRPQDDAAHRDQGQVAGPDPGAAVRAPAPGTDPPAPAGDRRNTGTSRRLSAFRPVRSARPTGRRGT